MQKNQRKIEAGKLQLSMGEVPRQVMSKIGLFFILIASICFPLSGCGKTVETILLDTPALKVMQINHTEHNYFSPTGADTHISYIDVFVNGEKLKEDDYSRMIYGKEADKSAAYPQYVPIDVVVLNDKSVLLRTRYSTPTEEDWRITRLYLEGNKLKADPLDVGNIGAELGFYDARMAGWVRVGDTKGNMWLIRKKPYEIHSLGQALYLLLVNKSVAIVLDISDKDAFLVRAVNIETGKQLAEYRLDRNHYETPYFDRTENDSSKEQEEWFTTNFEFRLAPVPSINLRTSNVLPVKTEP